MPTKSHKSILSDKINSDNEILTEHKIAIATRQDIASNKDQLPNLKKERFAQIKIATVEKVVNSGEVKNETWTYDHFKKVITSFPEGKGKTIKLIKNNLQGFVGGHFGLLEGMPKRLEKNLLFRNLIILDIDKYEQDFTTFEIALEQLEKYHYLAYSTSSHTFDKPKIRVIIFTSEDMLPNEFRLVATNFTNTLSFKDALDEASCKPNQLMCFSVTPKIINSTEEYVPWFRENEGELLNPKEFMQDLPKDTLIVNNRPNVKTANDNTGIVQAALDITSEEIEENLKNYPAEVLTYSEWLDVGMALHHQSEGKEWGLNIWDTWSKHDLARYEDRKDLKSKWQSFKFDKEKSTTFKTIIQRTKRDKHISKEGVWNSLEKEIDNLTERSSENDIKQIMKTIAQYFNAIEGDHFIKKINQKNKWGLPNLRKMLHVEVKKKEQHKVRTIKTVGYYSLDKKLPPAIFDGYIDDDKPPKCTLKNFEILIENYNIVIKYNAAKKKCEIIIPGREYSIDNEDNATLGEILSIHKDNNIEISVVKNYIWVIADKYRYNPIADFINSKPWDGISRLQTLYDTITTKESFPIVIKELLLRKWLISAVAAVLHKDFHSRGVLILQGEQSIGKTTWLSNLVPLDIKEYFRGGANLDPSNRDSVKSIISHWIAELGELESTFGKDLGKLKAFITNEKDIIRVPYAPLDSRFCRSTVLCGSVNKEEFLIDSTGNARFWVIPAEKIHYNHNIDMQQLWAEVAMLYKTGEKWWLTADEEKQLAEQNDGHFKKSPFEDMLWKIYDFNKSTEFEPVFEVRTYVERNATELLQELGYMQIKRSQRDEMVEVLLQLGCERLSHNKKFKLYLK